MYIALLDDEKAENEYLHELIDAYAVKKGYDIHCKAFTGGAQLLNEDKFDLYFLDYMMDEMNGIETAKALKKKFGGAVTICYLTGYEKAAAEVINQRIYADGFLSKPVSKPALYEMLDRFYNASFFRRLELKKGREYRTVYPQDILYVEASGKKCVIHFYNGAEEFNYFLSDMESDFLPGELFCRIHRSFIVNMMFVSSYDAKSVTLENGEILPVKIKNFREIYRNFSFTLEK
ncbi:MAG: LytTR family DNA-binding domain-containing protein [Clostridia bacterium]|nr:LytTR family DNA-binding domain-containing protein [Clostridia bacterium]